MPVVDITLIFAIVLAGAAFLLGSIPFGLIVARVMGLPDPRSIGSKNIGATNVLRTGSKPAALATLLLDGAKGLVAVLVARSLAGEDAAQLAALFAFLGHCFSIFLGFKGGKGVATFLGAMFGLSFILGAAAAVIWLATCALTRFSSVSAMMMAAMMPVVAFALGQPERFIVLTLLGGLLIWRHRENIARLRAGTESKVGGRST